MIIFENEKYACVRCIRGHRSSTCKHANRMLVKVRSRGRPEPAGVRKVIMVDKNSQTDLRSLEAFANCNLNYDDQKDIKIPVSGMVQRDREILKDSVVTTTLLTPNSVDFEATLNKQNSTTNIKASGGSCCNKTSKTKVTPADLTATPIPLMSATDTSNSSSCSSVASTPLEVMTPNTTSAIGQKPCCFINQKSSKSKKFELKYNEMESEDVSNRPKNCEGMDNQPILFLKTKSQNKALLVDGKLNIIDKTEKMDSTTNKENQDEPWLCEIKDEHDILETAMENVSTDTGFMFPEANISHSSHLANNIISDKDQQLVELFTQEGLLLSTSCSCSSNCACPNCLIHRKDDELNQYIQTHSSVPLSKMGFAEIELDHSTNFNITNNTSCGRKTTGTASVFPTYNQEPSKDHQVQCMYDEAVCLDAQCDKHPFQIFSINSILWNGLTNLRLTKKTGIKYRSKIIPSKHWWDLLVIQIPHILAKNPDAFDQYDILTWFNNVVELYPHELVTDMGHEESNINALREHWVLSR